MEITELIPQISVVVTILLSIFTFFYARRKTKADTADVLTGTALELLDKVKATNDDLILKIEKLEKRVSELESLLVAKDDRISNLERQRVALSKKQDEMEEHSVWRDNELILAIERIQQLEKERSELEGEITVLHDREDRRKVEYKELLDRMLTMDIDIKKLEQERNELQIKVEIFQAELEKRDKLIQELQQRIRNS